jgi:phosphatidylglycerol:prolipoprotein diacylglycerol transferase
MITAYPLEIPLGFTTLTGFGITMALAFLTGAWLVDRELSRNGLSQDFAGDIVMGAVIGGILGAKIWYVMLHPEASIFSRAGLVFYGGFVGGSIGVIVMGWRRRVPIQWTAHLVAPALAAAYAVGRVGCFVVGDDYGRPTDLPWAVSFPEGAPPSTAASLRSFGASVPPEIAPDTVLAVHPTQLYEVGMILIVFALLWRWRTRGTGSGWLFGAYLALAGLERFLVEFLRAKDDRILPMGLSIAQGTAIALMAIGVLVWVRLSQATAPDPGKYLRKA